jgi:hypothetical protein
MKTFALNLTTVTISSVELAKKSLHHVEVGSYSNKEDCRPFTCPTIARAAEKDMIDILFVSKLQWDLYRYEIEKEFKGIIILVDKSGKLLTVASNRRDTRSAAERQSDYNYFRFKQMEEVNNQIDF